MDDMSIHDLGYSMWCHNGDVADGTEGVTLGLLEGAQWMNLKM